MERTGSSELKSPGRPSGLIPASSPETLWWGPFYGEKTRCRRRAGCAGRPPRLPGELKVSVHEGDRYAAFTHGCSHALYRAGADIADGEDARGARFESERRAVVP